MRLERIDRPPLHLNAFSISQCTHLEALTGRAEKARAWTATRRTVDDSDDDVEATAAPDVFGQKSEGGNGGVKVSFLRFENASQGCDCLYALLLDQIQRRRCRGGRGIEQDKDNGDKQASRNSRSRRELFSLPPSLFPQRERERENLGPLTKRTRRSRPERRRLHD